MVGHGLARQGSGGITVLAMSLQGLQLFQGDVAAAFQTQDAMTGAQCRRGRLRGSTPRHRIVCLGDEGGAGWGCPDGGKVCSVSPDSACARGEISREGDRIGVYCA